jgi:hypothetical protein
MTRMPTEKMKLYQRDRRARIRGGEAVATVSGVLALVRGLEERVDRLEELNGIGIVQEGVGHEDS